MVTDTSESLRRERWKVGILETGVKHLTVSLIFGHLVRSY